MIGAIAGDIIGSRFERRKFKSTEFELFTNASEFTDDTALTVAIADSILHDKHYEQAVLHWGRKYYFVGYGGTFRKWLKEEIKGPYNSWGNGSAMRVSPVGFLFDEEAIVLEEAEKSAAITHNHPEGIKGAQAVAMAIFLAKNGKSKADIKACIESNFGYDLSRKLDDIRPTYKFDVSCQGSVPEAIIAFLESTDFENCIRLAISISGDSDTIACIAGSIAEAYYKEIPDYIIREVLKRIPNDVFQVVQEFYRHTSVFTLPNDILPLEFEFFWETESPFSQWHPSTFELDGITFNTAEQYMMYAKAKLFGDEDIAAKILQTNSPREQKALGREVRNFDAKVWEQHRLAIVERGNMAKFSQNINLKLSLLQTADKHIVEASPYDKIWGIGLKATDADAKDPTKWQGLNLLGKVLMKVRRKLRQMDGY